MAHVIKVLTACFALALSFGSVAARAEILTLMPRTALTSGQFKAALTGSYFRTMENFDAAGAKVALGNSGEFLSARGTLSLGYGLSDEISALADFQGVSNTVRTPTLEITNNGPGDTDIGLRYHPSGLPLRLLLEGRVQFPMYGRTAGSKWSQLSAASDVPAGEGTTELSIFALGELPLATDVYLGAGAGSTMRSLGFSNLVPYTAYFKYEENRGLFLRAGISGQLTGSEDQYTGTSTPERASTLLAGSLAMNSINPSFLRVDSALGGYVSASVFLAGGFQMPLSGKSYAVGNTYLAAVGVDIGGAAPSTDYTKSNRGFQEYYLTAQVVQVNKSLKLILIDKGRGQGIRVGELLDVFEPGGGAEDEAGAGETVARAKVLEAGPTRSKLQLLEVFKDVTIEEGFVVRRPVR